MRGGRNLCREGLMVTLDPLTHGRSQASGLSSAGHLLQLRGDLEGPIEDR